MSIYKNERVSVKISASGGQIFGIVLKKIKTKNLNKRRIIWHITESITKVTRKSF